MSNALAELAIHQFNKLDRFNIHRKEIAGFYPRLLKKSMTSRLFLRKARTGIQSFSLEVFPSCRRTVIVF